MTRAIACSGPQSPRTRGVRVYPAGARVGSLVGSLCAWGFVACLALYGCSSKGKPGDAPVASAAASVTASAPVASASASASSSPSDGVAWSGDYTAKKASVEPPEKVKDTTWKRDPGDKNVGPGKLSITIAGDTVQGTASGALGDLVISGILDGKTLRASVIPKDATAADAMTGTMMGEQSDAAITGTIRCTGPDAVVVREATFELKRGK